MYRILTEIYCQYSVKIFWRFGGAMAEPSKGIAKPSKGIALLSIICCHSHACCFKYLPNFMIEM
jgi:hypothetical protein